MIYPSSFEQLRSLAFRARAEGLPFELFWDTAVRPRRSQTTISWRTPEGQRPPDAVVWPSDTEIRNTDRVAVVTMKEGWRRAYEGLPQSEGEAAVVALKALLDGAGVGVELASAA